MNYPKRLIEVDLPIARISAHARREKDSRLGHIPQLHIYPAARPVAACRSVICASLWPDPADPLCPQKFREDADRIIGAFAEKVVGKGKIEGKSLLESASPQSIARWEGWCKSEVGDRKSQGEERWLELQGALLDFIADFANWDNATVRAYLETSRALTQAAHESLGGAVGTRPLVVDPFAGGGSIPLEALRVGADAFASDLSPVSVLINKVVLTFVPKYREGLAWHVREWGKWAQDKAKSQLSQFYPQDSDGAITIAYLFARTAVCEGPGCGVEVPLIRSLWLAKKRRTVAVRLAPNASKKHIDVEILQDANKNEVREGTVKRGSMTCPTCGFTTPAANVRTQLKHRRGGAADARLYCVVTTHDDQKGRSYRKPTEQDLNAISAASQELSRQRSAGLVDVPTEPTPAGGGRGAGRAFSQRSYGMDEFADLFNHRQLLALTTYANLAHEYSQRVARDDEGLAEAVNACLGLVVNRLADLNAALCGWQLSTPNTAHVFVRWALQMIWDYGEVNPLAGAGGSPESAIRRMLASIENLSAASMSAGHVELASAQSHPLPDDSAQAFVTDPPYYDAVPYADLLDFFFVWMKRTLKGRRGLLIDSDLTPKEPECIVDDAKGKTPDYFEKTIAKCFDEGRRVLNPSGIGIVVFAHKSTSSWERLIQAIVDSGWTITSSWPIDTEMGSRMRARESAVLASSVHLVCRPRETSAGGLREEIGEWREVLSELPVRIHEWMPRLAAEGVVGADAIFACLGPALEVFSRYSRVEKANGEAATLREYLEHVWAAVSTEALSLIFHDADAAGLEPDARLTAMWLWTLGGGKSGANGRTPSPQPSPARGEGEADTHANALPDGATDTDASTLAEGEADEDTAAEDEEAESNGKGKKLAGYTLEFDAARKIAQGLGVHLEKSEAICEVKGDKARLLPVDERTRYLFGRAGESGPTKSAKSKKKVAQKTLFDELGDAEAAEAGWTGLKGPPPGTTVLDRLHQAMILFAAGRGELMKRFLVEDGVGRDARFWKLAQSLSALYPTGSDEKRWVDGVLARKKGLGL